MTAAGHPRPVSADPTAATPNRFGMDTAAKGTAALVPGEQDALAVVVVDVAPDSQVVGHPAAAAVPPGGTALVEALVDFAGCRGAVAPVAGSAWVVATAAAMVLPDVRGAEAAGYRAAAADLTPADSTRSASTVRAAAAVLPIPVESSPVPRSKANPILRDLPRLRRRPHGTRGRAWNQREPGTARPSRP